MANANWSNPQLTSTYTNFVSEVKNRDEDLALQFDGTTSTNIPTNTIRWDSSANRWKKWSGSAWGELTSTYALTGLSTTGAATIGTTLGVTGVTTLSGGGTSTTPSTSDNSTAIATTAYVKAQGYATLASPTLTGTPLSTTAAVDTNTTQIATTAFVVGQAAGTAPVMNGTAAIGTSLRYARQDHVHASDTSRAPLASPTFTGTVTIPAGASISGYLTTSSASSTYAPLASPTFTGTVTIPSGASISGYLTTSSASSTYAALAGATFTGAVGHPAGSATGAGVQVGTGTTTPFALPAPGIYSPGTDQLAITTGGTGRLFVDASGRVGIGIASPLRSLVVSNAGAEGFEIGPGEGTNENRIVHYNRTSSSYITANNVAGAHVFSIGGTANERFRINSTGKALVGTSGTAYNAKSLSGVSYTPGLQVSSASGTDASSMGLFYWSNTGSGPLLGFNKARSGIEGSFTNAVASGDDLGVIVFNGSDGVSAFQHSVGIKAESEGTFSATSSPGRLSFWTSPSGAIAPVERVRLDSNGYLTGTVNGLGKGNYACEQYYRLNAALAGGNVTTAQNILGVGVTLITSTVYEFEGMFALSKTTGTTSHTISLGFGGTATINNIAFQVNTAIAPSGLTTGGTASIYEFQAAAGGVVDAAQATAGMHFMALVKGTVSINAGGTLIPQYTLSAAPGGAYSTILGSYFKIAPLGASGANTSIGTWA